MMEDNVVGARCPALLPKRAVGEFHEVADELTFAELLGVKTDRSPLAP